MPLTSSRVHLIRQDGSRVQFVAVIRTRIRVSLRPAGCVVAGALKRERTLDLQVGLYEMKVMPEKTGGCVVMSDSFSLSVYKDSLKKFLETDSTGRGCLNYFATDEKA